MKFFIATLLIAVTVGEAYSQDRNRGNRNRGSRADRDRGSRTTRTDRPARTRTDRPARTRTDRTNRTPRVDRNRPAPRVDRHRTNRTPRVDRTRPTPRVRRTPPPQRRVRRPHARPSRNYYGSRNYHRPNRYVYRPYRTYRHTPYGRRYSSHRRYNTRFDYYRHLRRNYRSHIYLNWVLFPSSRINGYYFADNYPYYIHNGYRHRYSYEDVCNYQLVDKYTHQVVRSNYPRVCSRGYDSCAIDRDSYNRSVRENRYFCAETIREDGYNYSTPTYDYDEYDRYDEYGYDNYNNDGRTTCYDYDPNSGRCYDNY